MQFNIEFKDEIKRAKKILGRYSKNIIPRAANRALNRTATTVQKHAKPALSKEMGIAQKHIKDSFFTTESNLTNLKAAVGVRYKPLALTKFTNTRQLKRGVVSKAYGKRRLYKGAFIATMHNGHTGAFYSSRKPGKQGRVGPRKISKSGYEYRSAKIIKQLFGPSPSRTFASRELTNINSRIASKRFAEVFTQEIKFRASKIR